MLRALKVWRNCDEGRRNIDSNRCGVQACSHVYGPVSRRTQCLLLKCQCNWLPHALLQALQMDFQKLLQESSGW